MLLLRCSSFCNNFSLSMCDLLQHIEVFILILTLKWQMWWQGTESKACCVGVATGNWSLFGRNIYLSLLNLIIFLISCSILLLPRSIMRLIMSFMQGRWWGSATSAAAQGHTFIRASFFIVNLFNFDIIRQLSNLHISCLSYFHKLLFGPYKIYLFILI